MGASPDRLVPILAIAFGASAVGVLGSLGSSSSLAHAVLAALVALGGYGLVLLDRRRRRGEPVRQLPASDSSPVGVASVPVPGRTMSSRSAEEEKFRRIFETMADGYYRSRLSDGRFIDVNPAAVRMLGYPSLEVLMQTTTSELYANLADRSAVLEAISQSGEFRGLEIQLRRHDGASVTVLVNGRMIYDADGRPVEVEANFFDMSAQKEAEAAREEAHAQAEQANRTKSTFLANMSHELRTPMNAIIGYSEMLLEDAEDEGNDDAAIDLRRIHAASTHLLQLINDILDLSKIEAGKMDIHAEVFEVGPLIEGVVSTVDTLVKKNDNRLSLELDPSLTQMRADVTKVRQALFNLLSNAAKFTRDGEIGLTVERQRVDGVERVRMSVSDSGIGIPPEKLDHVFEEFSQADDTTTRDFGGTGLGLPISRHFCRMMDGDITVESRSGEGSVFTIDLPIGMGTEPRSELVREADSSEAAQAAAEERTVLVIDDDPNAVDLLSRTLQGAGLRVVTASDGREALRLARTLKPSAITLDVLMPVMDGWSVLRELKADPLTRGIPVVMVTMTDDREQGYALGATEFLTKPIDRSRLVELLQRCAPEPTAQRALVVDDQEDSRALLRRALENADWQVTEAQNGTVALERVAEEQPSLILLDLMMPVMDGFEFVAELRKVEAWRQIPIVVVTAKDLTDEDRSRLNGDVVGLIQKSGIDRDSLLGQIRDQVAEAVETRPTE